MYGGKDPAEGALGAIILVLILAIAFGAWVF